MFVSKVSFTSGIGPFLKVIKRLSFIFSLCQVPLSQL
jgi:hypothetical protein